jgi:anaerobic selenocysteine-containing dehydrogenase
VTSGVSPPGERRSDWWLTTMISSQLAGPFIPGEQLLIHVVELFGETQYATADVIFDPSPGQAE